MSRIVSRPVCFPPFACCAVFLFKKKKKEEGHVVSNPDRVRSSLSNNCDFYRRVLFLFLAYEDLMEDLVGTVFLSE